jgi:hypothetical protein
MPASFAAGRIDPDAKLTAREEGFASQIDGHPQVILEVFTGPDQPLDHCASLRLRSAKHPHPAEVLRRQGCQPVFRVANPKEPCEGRRFTGENAGVSDLVQFRLLKWRKFLVRSPKFSSALWRVSAFLSAAYQTFGSPGESKSP